MQAFVPTGLTGRYLTALSLNLILRQSAPLVTLVFNDEGTAIFASTTKNNVGNDVAIFLDGKIISSPVVQQEIDNGRAQISGGNMTPAEAKLWYTISITVPYQFLLHLLVRRQSVPHLVLMLCIRALKLVFGGF